MAWLIFSYATEFQERFDTICDEIDFYNFDYHFDIDGVKKDFTFYKSVEIN